MGTTYIDSNGNLVTSENKKKKNTYTYIDDNGNLASAEVPNIPTTSKKKKKNAWINLTAFDDGYDFGDVTRSILGTSQDVGKNLFKGAMSAVEGINDYGAQIIGAGAHLVGAEKTANKLKDYAAGETFTNDNFMTKTMINALPIPGGVVTKKVLNTVDTLSGNKGSQFITDTMNKNIENTSVLGDSSREIAQGVGQLGGQVVLQSFGVPWQVTAFTGAASNEINEAFGNNANYGQAFLSGLISGMGEVATEYVGGGANKFLGMTSLGDKALEKLGGKMSNKLVSRLFKMGLDMTGEGLEETLSGYANAIGKKLTYMNDKEIKEIYSSDKALDDFIGGVLVTGIAGVPGNVRSIARGENAFTGLTANEQKVLDKELQNRIQEQQKDGKELSQKEINKIEEQVRNDMSKGRISVETIEEALGGNNTTQNDILLQNSYNERANRSVAYNADLSQYNEKQRAIVQKAIDSGVLNNTNRSHELVDLVAKLAEDKGMDFDFVNNEKLKDTEFALEGKQVNGYNTGTSIGINIDSNKALNSVIGHEITHVLEGTNLYNELQKSITEYAKTKGEYDTRLKELQELYKDVKDANVENELTSDLVGDYLFTDEDFVNRLYNNNRNVFQKIYDEIKYFVKQVAPGSKEAKQLEQVKRAFEKAYSQNNTNQSSDTKYSIQENQNNTQELDNSSFSIEERTSGDKLLDALDLIDEVKSVGAKVDENGYITLYHQTTNENADKIRETGKMSGKENGIFFSTSENASQAEGRGTTKLEFKIPAEKLILDDLFSDNADLKLNSKPGEQIDVSNYLVDTNAQTSTTDNQGRELSKQQQEYFKDSKVRDENGNLEVVYHGTPNDFTVFDISKSNDVALGNGLYFTNVESTADSYANNSETSGKIMEGYLDIKNPINNEFKTISFEDFKNLYETLDSNKNLYDEEMGMSEIKTLLSDYGDVYNENIDSILKKYYDAYDDDVSLIDNLSYMNNVKELYETIRKTTGIDGIIVEHPSDFAPYEKYYIAFNSNQFKNVDNTNPTSNEDIRYSLSEQNKKIAPTGNYQIKGKDVKLEKIAPVKETKPKIPTKADIETKEIPKNTTKENINNKNENVELPFEIDENELPFETTTKTNKVNTKGLDDRTINKITNNLKGELGLDKYQRNEMKKVLSEISSRDNISKAEIEKEIINRFAEKTLKIRQDEIAQIQKELKNTKVKVSDNIKLDIADYSDFRQKNYGKIGFSKDGQGVDQVYERLSKEHPEFFPRDILAASDQLQEMAYVANLDKYVTETSILDNERIKNATDWIYDSIEDYNLQQQVRNGEISYDDYKEQSKIGKLKKTRKIVQDELGKEMGITLEDLSKGKDISSIGYQRTDPIRLNEKVFGSEVGQKINDATINRTKHNEAERTRFLNKERQEIKDLGIKARSAESAAVQKYGEKQYVDDKGVIHKYGDAELAAEFPNVETQDKIKEAAKVLRKKYDTYLDDINKVITEMGYDPIPKRPDYMRHFQEINDKLSQWGIPLNPSDMSKDTLPTDINGVTDQFKPGKNWFASAMQRKGFKTTYDAITGIDGYLEGASNLMYHTGDIQRYRTLSKMIRETYGQQHGMDNLDVSTKEGQQRLNDIMDNKLSKYAAWLDEQANALAGKKGGIDRAAERLLGRKIYTVLDAAKKQVGSNMTGFNVRSALTNFASAVQGASKTKKTAFIKGTISTFKNMVHNDGLINKSDFLTNRFGSDQLSKKLWQKASNAGQIFMTGSDYFTANQIWRSKYFENLSKGMNETQAIKNADDFASRIMGDRSKGSTAEIFNSKTLGLLTQFQLEVNNQWSSIVHDNKMDIQRGNKSGATVVFQLGELAAASYFFNNLMKSLTGSDVMIDPIDMLMKMLGADDDDKDKTVGERATEVVGDLIDDLPFASIMTGGRVPMSEAFKGAGTAFKKLSGQKDKYGNDISWKDVGGDLIESGAYWLLPTGYGQLRKTKSGLEMYDEDLPMPGSYTKTGNLRFRADESAEGKIKAALFGQYSSEEARKYMESGYKTVDKRKLGELQELDFPTSKYLEYKKELSDAGKSNIAKLDYLESTDKYTDREKNIMYKSILRLKDDEINRMNELMDVEEQNEYMYVKTQANAIKRDEDLTASEKKEQIVDLILDTDFDDEALAYLYSKFYTKEEKLQNILNADIPMKEYIKFDSQDFDGEFDESKGKTKANSKKYEMMRYIEGLNLSAVQKALLTKSKYSSFKAYDRQIEQYIQDRNISLLDKYKLVKYAGFKSHDKEIANYVAGLNKTADEKEKLYKEMGFTTHNGRVYYK